MRSLKQYATWEESGGSMHEGEWTLVVGVTGNNIVATDNSADETSETELYGRQRDGSDRASPLGAQCPARTKHWAPKAFRRELGRACLLEAIGTPKQCRRLEARSWGGKTKRLPLPFSPCQ